MPARLLQVPREPRISASSQRMPPPFKANATDVQGEVMARKINPDNLPWFPFHALKWEYSATVMGMTKAERGIYHDLLVENWLAGDIPALCDGCRKASEYPPHSC